MKENLSRILILDFGSQYTGLIFSSLKRMGVSSVVYPGDVSSDNIKEKYSGIILSGGAESVYSEKISFDPSFFDKNIPILGICYGHQLIAKHYGATVVKGDAEYSRTKIKLLDVSNSLFKGFSKKSLEEVWMSHRDQVKNLPDTLIELALSEHNVNAAFKDKKKEIYGVQFHPEVSHTNNGEKILRNFCIEVCGIKENQRWEPELFFNQFKETFDKKYRNKKILLGLSGGVDSLTLAYFLRQLVTKKEDLLCVYVDSGLMMDCTKNEVIEFCRKYNIVLQVLEKKDDFFSALKGKTHPTDKGMAIGELFVRIFEDISVKENCDLFAQGTIWSDVVESGISKFSSQIKPHHNVGGLPKKHTLNIIEPFRFLFKDEVRSIAKWFDLSREVVEKKVFPGPGFAIRVIGEVTEERVSLVRKSTEIVERVLSTTPEISKIWMAFTILTPIFNLGVVGDERRENKYALVIRIVESKNSMTAEYSKRIYPYLEEISTEITNSLEIGRVVYDITNKPPATIEWE